MKRWDKNLAGTRCSACNGTGQGYEHGDAHRSPGSIPCKQGYFQGHGYPTCHRGTLQFSDYDLKHWTRLKKDHPKPRAAIPLFPKARPKRKAKAKPAARKRAMNAPLGRG